MNNIKFNLIGKSHDNKVWPKVKIVLQNKILFDDNIKNNKIISFDIDDDIYTNTCIKVIQYGKRFGENGVYDTFVDDSGNIIDQAVLINQIVVDDLIDIHDLFHYGSVLHSHSNENYILQKSEKPYLCFNSTFSLEIKLPILDWIIEQRIVEKNKYYNEIDPETHSALIGSPTHLTHALNNSTAVNLINEIEYMLDNEK